MLTSEKFKEKALSDPEVRAEYEALEPEFALFDELLRARKRAGFDAGGNRGAHGHQASGGGTTGIRGRQCPPFSFGGNAATLCTGGRVQS